MKIVKVVLKKSAKSFDIEYTYIAGDDLADGLSKGSMVKIPFGRGNKVIDAYIKEIIEPDKYNNEYPIENLKYIIAADENETKNLNSEFVSMTNWMSKQYICSRAAAIKLMTAPGEDKVNEKVLKKARLVLSAEELGAMIAQNKIKKIYQIEILEYLKQNGETEVSELTVKFSVSNAVINTMIKNGYIYIVKVNKEITTTDNSYANKRESVKQDSPKILTSEQQSAVTELKTALHSDSFKEYLLHGVTGSGKTEIYLNIIKETMDMGRTAIVLVPEISLTPQMSQRFKARFQNEVAILHSRLSLKERNEQWKLIKKGQVKLVVGARSAVFAPFENLGVVIIDEEHENTYKSETTPKYHAGEIARFRCQFNKALLVYGSATPSIETSYKVQTKEIGYIKLKERASGIQLPTVKVVDMRQEFENGNTSIFSDELRAELEKNFSNKEQTMILINKRGYSHTLSCRKCGYTPRCPNCETSMTYHASNGRIICHYCGQTEKAETKCPNCEGLEMKQSGFGTQRVEAELQKLYPDIKILRMDMDTTKGRDSHEDILRQFVEDKADILIGTQMIAKGHDFENVTLVGILAADAGLNLEDFRASEKTFQLVTQAAGRAGRGSKPGRVIIQAQNVDDYTITAASNQDYRHFYMREIMFRRQLDFPPFTNMAVMGMNGADDKEAYDAAVCLKNALNDVIVVMQDSGEVQVLGPARCPLSKLNGKYRWRVIIKCRNLENLIKLCTKSAQNIEKKKFLKTIGLVVDINPVNML